MRRSYSKFNELLLFSYFQFLVLPLLNNLNLPAKTLILKGLRRFFIHFPSTFLLLCFYFASTLPLLTIYYNSTSQISVHYAAISATLLCNQDIL